MLFIFFWYSIYIGIENKDEKGLEVKVEIFMVEGEGSLELGIEVE